MTGHELSDEIIRKHGTDRYPTVELSLLKLMEEVGELTGSVIKGQPIERIRKEYGDVGLTLYALGTKLGMDLEKVMSDVVRNDTRIFRNGL